MARRTPRRRIRRPAATPSRSPLSTALAAADAGTEVLVVADACAGADGSHLKALHVMDLYRPLIRVTTIADLLAQPHH